MSAEHPLDLDGTYPAFVWSHMSGLTCAVCAPSAMTARQIEAFVTATLGPPSGGTWFAVDKSKLGLGRRTPEFCNIGSGRAAGRRHWFLVDATRMKAEHARCK